MSFEEIFKKDGLYVADGFKEGFAFQIIDGTLTGITYKDKDDLVPTVETFPVYRGLFTKDYEKVYTRQSLFSESIKMTKEELLNSLVGKGVCEAKVFCKINNYDFRVVRRDDENYMLTMDLQFDRVNIAIDHDKVSEAYFG